MLLTMCNAMSNLSACEKIAKQAKNDKEKRRNYMKAFIKALNNLKSEQLNYPAKSDS
ncbi:MAG: hypothetical protein ACI4IS_00255 [Acutalibacteraceae bacterium]